MPTTVSATADGQPCKAWSVAKMTSIRARTCGKWLAPGRDQADVETVVANRVAIINPSRVPEQESLFLAQVPIPGVPSLDTIGQQQVWVVLAFILIAVVVIVGGGGFLILKGSLELLKVMVSNESEADKKIQANTDAVADLKRTNTAALYDVATTNSQIVSGLEQLKNSNTTITGTMRQIVANNQDHNKELLEHYVSTTGDLTSGFNATGLEILKQGSTNTERTINALSAVPQATADIVIASHPDLVNMIAVRVNTELMPAFIVMTEKIVKDVMEENRKLNLAADASDVLHSADAAQHTADVAQHATDTAALSLIDGEKNRQIIDGEAA